MIFVTVGTHEQSFERLIRYIDNKVSENEINEKVIIQKGYTEYMPQRCEFFDLIGYDDMKKYIDDARIIITHGGPASFIAPLTVGKIPIVVPRLYEHNEHVNNHQLQFAKEVEKRMKNIIVVEDINDLIDTILHYDEKIKNLNNESLSNNSKFCNEFESIVNEVMK